MKVTMTVTETQARCIVSALDLYLRIGIGQIEEIADLVRCAYIETNDGADWVRCIENVETLCKAIKAELGHPSNGSYGIGHKNVRQDAKRAFEIKKQIDRAMSMHRDPNPSFRGVDYDGRIVRYTDDPDIVMKVLG